MYPPNNRINDLEIAIRLIESHLVCSCGCPPRAGQLYARSRAPSGQADQRFRSGRETLRIRSARPAAAAAPAHALDTPETAADRLALERINLLLEQFMGIADDELALSIWETGRQRQNPHDFLLQVAGSELALFEFSQEMIFDLWAAIHDSLRP